MIPAAREHLGWYIVALIILLTLEFIGVVWYRLGFKVILSISGSIATYVLANIAFSVILVEIIMMVSRFFNPKAYREGKAKGRDETQAEVAKWLANTPAVQRLIEEGTVTAPPSHTKAD